MDHKKTHIYAFYIASAAVIIIIFTLLVALWYQSTIPEIQRVNTESTFVSTDTEETESPELSSLPGAPARFLISDASDLSCTKAATDSHPVNNCKGVITVVPTEAGDETTQILNITKDTKLIHEGEEKDIANLYKIKAQQNPITFTMDGNNNTTSIEFY